MLSLLQTFCLMAVLFGPTAMQSVYAQSPTDFGRGAKLHYTTDLNWADIFDGKTTMNFCYLTLYEPDSVGSLMENALTFKVDHPVEVKGYRLFTDDYESEVPKSWVFMGSADNGQTWDLLDERVDDETLVADLYSYHTFTLSNPTTKKYDMFLMASSDSHEEEERWKYWWKLNELELVYARCDAFGHRDALVKHDQCEPTCTQNGYTETCYECINCGGFFYDKNGHKKFDTDPTILPTRHNFANGTCSICHSTDNRLSAFNSQGVEITFPEKDADVWAVFENDAVHGAGLHSKLDAQLDWDGGGNSAQWTIGLRSDHPFEMSFKATHKILIPQAEPESHYFRVSIWKDGMEAMLNSQDEDEVDPSEAETYTMTFGEGYHEVTFDVTDDQYGDEWDNHQRPCAQLNLWDIKVQSTCNHVAQERELVKTLAASCVMPERKVYRCLNCNEEYEVRVGEVDSHGHKHLVHGHPGTESTCTDFGFTDECWFCKDCNSCFSDAAATVEIPSDYLVNPQGHNYVDNVCTRCGGYEDPRISYFRLNGVKATMTDLEGSEAGFGCKPTDMEGDYTFVDPFGVTRTLPANAIVSQGQGMEMSRAAIDLESEEDFFLTFKLDYSVKSEHHYGKVMKVLIDGDEENAIATDEAYDTDEHAYETAVCSVMLPAGKHRLTLQYGYEFYESNPTEQPVGADYGYLYDFAACTHQGTMASTMYFDGDCVSPSLTQRLCHNCEWCDTIPGELRPDIHHGALVHSSDELNGQCCVKPVAQEFYHCLDCENLYKDALGKVALEGEPFGEMREHEWGADGNCVHCHVSRHAATPTTPRQITEQNYVAYGLPRDFVGYYAISTTGELYGYAKMINDALISVNEAYNNDEEITLEDSLIVRSNAVLLCDIDVNPSVLDGDHLRSDVAGLNVWPRIGAFGFVGVDMDGVFDGRGHTISGLYRPYSDGDRDDNLMVGLFANHYGTIRNVKIADSYFKGNTWVGALAGNSYGTIENCQVQAMLEVPMEEVIEGYRSGYAGLIAGETRNKIINCYAEGILKGQKTLGGICGENSEGNVMNCLANVKFETAEENSVGGIAAINFWGNLTNCYYVMQNTEIGVASDGSVDWENCATQADPVTLDMLASGEVAYSLSRGAHFEIDRGYWGVDVYDFPGTSWGQTLGTDLRPVNTGDGAKVYKLYLDCEGDEVAYSNTYSPMAAEGHFYDSKGVCLKSKNRVHYEPCPIDEEDGTYLISNYGQLYSYMAQVNAGNAELNARLLADITINDSIETKGLRLWTPIAQLTGSDGKATGFKGHFDGQGHRINGIYCEVPNGSGIGFFSRLEDGSEVKNVILENSTFKANYEVGGIAGNVRAGATVDHCAVIDCHISGGQDAQYIGGVVGANRGIVNACYTTSASIYGFNLAGTGEIIRSYYQASSPSAVNEQSFAADELKSGSLCYRLNGKTVDEDTRWRQTLPGDDYPVLADTAGYVYYGIDDCVNPDHLAYSNFEVWPDRASHLYDNGVCDRCHQNEPAVEHEGWYEIGNKGQLYWAAQMANEAKNETAFRFRIVDDITVNSNIFDEEGNLKKGQYDNWTPMGTAAKPFMGIIDGQGHTISGIYCVQDEIAALVGYMQGQTMQEGTPLENYYGIRNLTISDSYFNATTGIAVSKNVCEAYSAAFVSRASTHLRFKGLLNKSKITTEADYAAGVVGLLSDDCIVDSCSNQGNVYGYTYAGGVVSRVAGTSRVLYSTNNGRVAANDTKYGKYAGGVVAVAESTTVRKSDGTGDNAIVGCVNLENAHVSGYQSIGGVVGYIHEGTGVESSYNLGKVEGASKVSGVVGQAIGTGAGDLQKCGIYQCYNAGEVVSTSATLITNYIANASSCEIIGCFTLNDQSTNLASGQAKAMARTRSLAVATPSKTIGDVTIYEIGGGDLCYALNQSAGKQIFRQRLGVDTYPVLVGPRVYKHSDDNTSDPLYRNFEEGDLNGDGIANEEDVHFLGKVLTGKETDYYGVTLEEGETEVSISSVARKIEQMKK